MSLTSEIYLNLAEDSPDRPAKELELALCQIARQIETGVSGEELTDLLHEASIQGSQARFAEGFRYGIVLMGELFL